MASALLVAGRISRNEAEEQFERLFEKYLEITVPRPQISRSIRVAGAGIDQLESGKGTEFDEICTDSVDDNEQQDPMNEVAKELAKLGDKYNKQFGGNLGAPNNSVILLTKAFKEVTKFEYSSFETAMKGQTPLDRNVANLVLLMNISSKVVANVGGAANKAGIYFQRYIQENYADKFVEAGGVKEFVGQQ